MKLIHDARSLAHKLTKVANTYQDDHRPMLLARAEELIRLADQTDRLFRLSQRGRKVGQYQKAHKRLNILVREAKSLVHRYRFIVPRLWRHHNRDPRKRPYTGFFSAVMVCLALGSAMMTMKPGGLPGFFAFSQSVAILQAPATSAWWARRHHRNSRSTVRPMQSPGGKE